jgi:hypothetical protein
MALNPLYSVDQLPTTDQAAIREFNDRYLAAIGASQPTGWADTLGDLVPANSPLVTFPVSQLRTRYLRTEGENRFKKLRAQSFDVKTEEFDDGFVVKAKDLYNKLFAYRRWQEAPARFVTAEAQFRHTQIAALLEAGASTLSVDGQNFFSATHPANQGDSTVTPAWSNYQSTAKDVVSITNLAAEVALMMSVRDENGVKLGVYPDTILVPTEKYEGLKNLLAQAIILGGPTTGVSNGSITNPYMGRFNVVPVKEFTSAVDWYLIDSKMSGEGFSPWVSVRETVPQTLALRSFDESSDYYKDTGNLKMSSHIWYGFGLALPQAIRKVVGL